MPKITRRNKNHRVLARRDSWCFTIRGPWSVVWTEYDGDKDETTFLSTGRNVVGSKSGIHLPVNSA